MHYILVHTTQMAAKDGSIEVWCDDAEGHCSNLSLRCFVSQLNKRLRGSGEIQWFVVFVTLNNQ